MICVLWTASGVTRDITRQVGTVKWSGEYTTVARTLSFSLVRPRSFAGIERLNLAPGDSVELLHDGESIFTGTIWAADTGSNADSASYTAYDGGVYMTKNTASLKITDTPPELAVLQLLQEYGVPPGVLAATGTRLTHTFIAQTLYKIVQTLYNRAAALTGDTYRQVFLGRRLHVIRLGLDSQTLVVRPGSNLLYSTVGESLDKTVNRVRIVDERQEVVSELIDAQSIAAHGLLTRDVRQAEGAGDTAAGLFSPQAAQDIVLHCLGDHRSITGRCVIVEDPVTGLHGLYHIAKDVHCWERGQYTNALTISFNRLTDSAEVGEAGAIRSAKTTLDAATGTAYWYPAAPEATDGPTTYRQNSNRTAVIY